MWEDNVPQTINSVLHQDLPLPWAYSWTTRVPCATSAGRSTAAIVLLKESNRLDEAFVVNFSDHAYLDQGFTTDRVALNRGLSRVDSRGTTALYDAAAASANELSKHAKHPKQVLLVITDGADNASRQTLEQAIRGVQNLGGPVIYSIGLLYDDDRQGSRARKEGSGDAVGGDRAGLPTSHVRCRR